MLDSHTRRETVRPTLPTLFVAAVVALQIAYPLTGADLRDDLTVAIVCIGAAAALAHATHDGHARALVVLAGVGVLGFAAEVVGVHTGLPFGRYAYTDSLGPQMSDVPLAIGLAWIMMSWPAAVATRLLVTDRAARVVVGAWALASWDLFLDPQMVDAGHWRWADPTPHLPGVPTVPLSNFVGWLIVSVVISIALQALPVPDPPASSGPMVAFFLWTYASSILALAVFLGLPAAAAWGAVGMGVVAVPLAVRWRG